MRLLMRFAFRARCTGWRPGNIEAVDAAFDVDPSHDDGVTVDDLLSHVSVDERCARLAAASVEVHRTFQIGCASREPRETGPSWAEWRGAVELLHAAQRATYRNPLWGRVKAALADGEPTAREGALVYLEVDPWCFRSGYEKAELMRGLSRLDLSDPERARVRRIVLHVVQQHRRREFPQLVRLAASVHDAELDARLRELAANAPPGVQAQIELLMERVAHRAHSDHPGVRSPVGDPGGQCGHDRPQTG